MDTESGCNSGGAKNDKIEKGGEDKKSEGNRLPSTCGPLQLFSCGCAHLCYQCRFVSSTQFVRIVEKDSDSTTFCLLW